MVARRHAGEDHVLSGGLIGSETRAETIEHPPGGIVVAHARIPFPGTGPLDADAGMWTIAAVDQIAKRAGSAAEILPVRLWMRPRDVLSEHVPACSPLSHKIQTDALRGRRSEN